jgi:hypothetical protein
MPGAKLAPRNRLMNAAARCEANRRVYENIPCSILKVLSYQLQQYHSAVTSEQRRTECLTCRGRTPDPKVSLFRLPGQWNWTIGLPTFGGVSVVNTSNKHPETYLFEPTYTQYWQSLFVAGQVFVVRHVDIGHGCK